MFSLALIRRISLVKIVFFLSFVVFLNVECDLLSDQSIEKVRIDLFRNFFDSNLKSENFDEYKTKLFELQKNLLTWRNSECMLEMHKRIDSSLIDFTQQDSKIWQETLLSWRNLSDNIQSTEILNKTVSNLENMVKNKKYFNT